MPRELGYGMDASTSEAETHFSFLDGLDERYAI